MTYMMETQVAWLHPSFMFSVAQGAKYRKCTSYTIVAMRKGLSSCFEKECDWRFVWSVRHEALLADWSWHVLQPMNVTTCRSCCLYTKDKRCWILRCQRSDCYQIFIRLAFMSPWWKPDLARLLCLTIVWKMMWFRHIESSEAAVWENSAHQFPLRCSMMNIDVVTINNSWWCISTV